MCHSSPWCVFPLSTMSNEPNLLNYMGFPGGLGRKALSQWLLWYICKCVYTHIHTQARESIYSSPHLDRPSPVCPDISPLHTRTNAQEYRHMHVCTHSQTSLPLTICLPCLAKACDPAGLIEAEGLSMHREAGRVDVSCNKTSRHQWRDKIKDFGGGGGGIGTQVS